MSKPLIKLTLVAAAATAATLLAVWVARSLRKPKDLEFVRAPGASAGRARPVAPRVAPPASAPLDDLGGEHGPRVYPASTFRRFALTPEEVGRWIGQRDIRLEYDPYAYFKYKPGLAHEFEWEEMPRGKWLLRTNSFGLREDDEPLASRPDLRIVVAGDSHTDGVCDNADSFANVLEALLRKSRPSSTCEVLNAGLASTTFYNYLGMLERSLALEPDVFIVAVYGGNDFEEALTLFHLFHGTTRPPGMELYGDQINAAFEVHRPCVGQAFNQVKYFATHRDQIDVALQAARDVSTEIVATCARFGVHPIFVYIPPFDVDSNSREHRATMDQVLQVLGLDADDEQLSLRMADSYLAFLRSLRVDTLDMREAYRGRTERLYWLRDHHSDIAAQRLIAQALQPLVDAAVPAEAQRVRWAPRLNARLDARSRFELMSPGAPDPDGPTIGLREPPRDPIEPPWKLALANEFELPSIQPSRVRELFELLDVQEPDAQSWFRYRSNVTAVERDLRTNSLGLRMEGEVARSRASWRVALLGDEQLIGACAASETAARVLVERFAKRHPARPIECLDASCEGYGLHNDLGAFERLREHGLDQVVLCVNGGNDFDAALHVERALGRAPGEETEVSAALASAFEVDATAARAFLGALARFHANTSEARDATRIALDITRELARRCDEAGIELTLVYVPSPLDLERAQIDARYPGWMDQLGLTEKDLRAHSRIAVNFLSYARGQALETLDLTGPFRELAGAEFDLESLRLNAVGQARLAEFLVLSIEHQPRWFSVDR